MVIFSKLYYEVVIGPLFYYYFKVITHDILIVYVILLTNYDESF